MIDLSIIVLNYNTKLLLKQCLSSVFKYTKGITFEVIVVDNASNDGSAAFIKQYFKKEITWLQNKENYGFAKGNNVGIKEAKGKYILLLNSDTAIDSNCFSQLISRAQNFPLLGIAAPRLKNADGSVQPSTAPFFNLIVTAVSLFRGDFLLRRSPQQNSRVDWVSGACFLISRQLIEKIGLLDENFFMYLEEMEYCYRAKKAGFEVWFFPEAEIFHLVRGSSPEGKQKAIWWTFEGLQYFYSKHFGRFDRLVLKLLLWTKASLFWLVGMVSGNEYLKKTYAKAFKLVK